jgi:uncharacterized protein YgiM (DUF1202 family)
MQLTALVSLLTAVIVSLAGSAHAQAPTGTVSRLALGTKTTSQPSHPTPTTATVSRNAILHAGPSSSSRTVSHLVSGAKLGLLAPYPTRNYYHVRTAQGDEGWIWSRNIHIIWPPSKIGS